MTKYEERLIEHGSLFSRHAIKKWIGISTVACAFFMLWLGVSTSPLAVVFSIAQSISWLFATGIPFAAGASLLFSSKRTHRNIVEHIESGRKNQFSQLFLSYSVMIMSMLVAAALAAFTMTAFASHHSTIFAILPFIATTLLISLLFCPIFVLVALIVDDTKVSFAIGIVLAIAITMTTGLPGNPINYAEVAFLSPAHMLSGILALILSISYEPFGVGEYFGIRFAASQLLLPLLVLYVFSSFCYWFASRVYSNNIQRWTLERDAELSDPSSTAKLQPMEPQRREQLTRLTKELESRRWNFGAVSVAILLLLPLLGSSFVPVRQNEYTQVVYTSRDVIVDIGDWLYGPFSTEGAPSNFDLDVRISGEILNWPGGSGEVWFTFTFTDMALDDVQQLNSTEMDNLFGSSSAGNIGTTGTFHTSGKGPVDSIENVWLLRFNEVNGENTGQLIIHFQIILGAIEE